MQRYHTFWGAVTLESELHCKREIGSTHDPMLLLLRKPQLLVMSRIEIKAQSRSTERLETNDLYSLTNNYVSDEGHWHIGQFPLVPSFDEQYLLVCLGYIFCIVYALITPTINWFN